MISAVTTRGATPKLSFHVLDTGFCTALESHMLSGGRHVRVPVHAISVLLLHPAQGWSLFDTGYAPRILHATRPYPFRIYRWVTPMTITPELAVINQLNRFGLCVEDISRIVISHFHADHVAGLRDFPTATFTASREAWLAARDLTSMRALKNAFLPSLMPVDFEQRVSLIDEFDGPEVVPFGRSHDLFSDGSALLIRLPGHAKGQLGLLVETVAGRLFFVADSYYMIDSIRKRILPHPITRFFAVHDWRALGETIHKLSDFAEANPEVRMVATHCPEAFRSFVQQAK